MSPASPALPRACTTVRLTAVARCSAFLASCGGGGGNTIGGTPIGLPASSTLAEQCVAPRPAGTVDPTSGNAYGDLQGSLATEKAFLRSWIDETYVWYQDVRALPAATLDPTSYATPLDYFKALQTPLNDAAGQPKDKFHFTYNTVTWDNLALQGVQFGYGFEVALLVAKPDMTKQPPQPRSAVVAYTDNGSAAAQSIGRGAAILTVDGVDLGFGTDVATLMASKVQLNKRLNAWRQQFSDDQPNA